MDGDVKGNIIGGTGVGHTFRRPCFVDMTLRLPSGPVPQILRGFSKVTLAATVLKGCKRRSKVIEDGKAVCIKQPRRGLAWPGVAFDLTVQEAAVLVVKN